MIRFLFIVYVFLGFSSLSAQSIQLTRMMPSVVQNGVVAALGFAGGLNSPQFSAIDFNRDGLNDLFLFDRVGDVPMALLRQADGTFRLAQEQLAHFPVLESWVLLRDYNNDGVMDIFTYNSFVASGVKVFRGYYATDGLIHFERFNFDNELNIIFVPTANGQQTQLYVSDIDYPAISDADCDGDLDIVAGNLGFNYKFHASYDKPFHIYTNDFDYNGTEDIFLAKY